MKTLLLTGLVVILVLGGSYVLLHRQAADRSLPATPLIAQDGSQTSLVAICADKQQPLVINFWASWSPPCRAEMPMLANAQKRYPGIVFVFVNEGETTDDVAGFLTSLKMPLEHVLRDPHQTVKLKALPTTLFFNGKGQFVREHIGKLSRATLSHSLESLGIDNIKTSP